MIRGVAIKRFFSQNVGRSLKGSPTRWREASSIILAAKRAGECEGGSTNKCSADFSVLMLRRSRESSFLSNRVVFPGGVVDDEDFDPKWKGIFEEYISTQFSELLSTFTCDQTHRPRPPMVSERRPNRFLPADVALRIAAIRETFEESGILLVRSKDAPPPPLTINESSRPTEMQMVPEIPGLLEWRRRIKKTPSEFHNLCQELHLVPDIWALKEWSNWLTPDWSERVNNRIPSALVKRFDAIFYLCCLNEIPIAKADKTEVFSPKWARPGELLLLSKQHSGGIRLVDPQLYELSRLRNFNSLNSLSDFATNRQMFGTQRMQTVMVKCSDGWVHAFNGDDFHPEDSEPKKLGVCSSHSAKSIEELRKDAVCLNRIEWHKTERDAVWDESAYTVQCNFAPKDHVSPYTEDD